MTALTTLCIELDNHHHTLYSTYKKKLKLSEPHAGFLSEDCFTPVDEDECYPWIEYSFRHILVILKKLKANDPSEVHQWLGVVVFFGVNINKSCTDKEQADFAKINKLLVIAKLFLKQYQYKLDAKYQQNLAILTLAKYYRALKKSYFKNFSPQKELFKQTRLELKTKKKFTLNLTLENIAEQVVNSLSAGINARSLTFIAIGIREDEQPVITTNYHAPVVYRLADMLNSERFQQIEDLRAQYKKDHNASTLTFERKIHAETMIAALSKALDVETIVIIDGAGKKKQNCAFCSNYLQENGYGSEPHFQVITNYLSPTQQQIEQAAAWFNYLISDKREPVASEQQNEISYDFLTEKTNKLDQQHGHVDSPSYNKIIKLLDQKAQKIALSLDEKEKPGFIFDEVKQNYPHQLGQVSGLIGSYHLSYKLAHAEDAEIEKTFNCAGEMKTGAHQNNKIQLMDDGRLKLSEDKKQLEPVAPHSPRSRKISKYSNEWLNAGNGTGKINFDKVEGIITLTRIPRSMK